MGWDGLALAYKLYPGVRFGVGVGGWKGGRGGVGMYEKRGA